MPPKYEVKARDRIRKGLLKYVEVLRQAAQRGIGEEDTSIIVRDMLVDLLGYDRFGDITGQYAVRGRWADWAVKNNEALSFFVEVKSLGTKLRERDLFQVVAYSRQHSLEWSILSTGDVWECHRVASGQEAKEFFEIRVLDSAQPINEKVDYFYLLTKEGTSRGALQEQWSQSECLRPEKLAKLLLSDEVLGSIRRAVHRDSPGRRVEVCDLREALTRGVIRGDLYEIIMQEPNELGRQKQVRPIKKKVEQVSQLEESPTLSSDEEFDQA
jgi:hypothetical protein